MILTKFVPAKPFGFVVVFLRFCGGVSGRVLRGPGVLPAKPFGFTLIEILVALMVLSGAAVILMGIRSGNAHRMDKVRSYQKVVMLLERKMSELEVEWFRGGFASIPREGKGVFKEDPEFSWSVETKPIEITDLQNSVDPRAWDENALLIIRSARQFLSRSIKEARLTVHHRRGLKTSRYSLTTYIVNYDQDIQLSFPGGGGM